ncbi:hypothetical protein Hdeb2414_s0002g00048931 [Helianthus debilis subsp. tardiflorus]
MLFDMCRELVFETEAGIGLYFFQLKDLFPSEWIGAGIVNCFASTLNVDERYRIKDTNIFGVADRIKGTKPCLFCHTDCYTEDLLCNPKYGDAERLERFRIALFLVVEKKVSRMTLTNYCVICFVILEFAIFILFVLIWKKMQLRSSTIWM